MTQLNQHIEAGEHGRREPVPRRAWQDLIELILLVAVFGIALVFRARPDHDQWPQHWNAVFLALGFLTLGFGAGMLVYRHRQRSETEALRAQYADLHARVRTLSEEIDGLIERKRKQGG